LHVAGTEQERDSHLLYRLNRTQLRCRTLASDVTGRPNLAGVPVPSMEPGRSIATDPVLRIRGMISVETGRAADIGVMPATLIGRLMRESADVGAGEGAAWSIPGAC
jgi:hypothetical protein